MGFLSLKKKKVSMYNVDWKFTVLVLVKSDHRAWCKERNVPDKAWMCWQCPLQGWSLVFPVRWQCLSWCCVRIEYWCVPWGAGAWHLVLPPGYLISVTWVRTLVQLLGIPCPFRPKWQEAKRQYQVLLFLRDVLKHGCLNSPMMCNAAEKLWRTESNFFIIAGSDKLQ